MNPYSSCNSLTGKELEDCKKRILVKYLYAIVKYEKGEELSVYALDDVAEVLSGDLSVPNDVSEYYITEVKDISTSNSVSTAQYQESYSITLGTTSGCGVGSFAGSWYGSYLESWERCISTFNLPAELIARSNEVNKVEIENFTASENIDGLRTFLNISNPYSAGFSPVQADIDSGITDSYSTPAFDYKLGISTDLDITDTLLPWITGKTLAGGIRFSSNMSWSDPGGIGIETSGSTLKVTFKRDADQLLRAYHTPLVTNPKDTSVYENVLTVLERIDKEYAAANGTMISGQTFDEIKTSDATTTEAIVGIFDENEKLQKNDTLASVWEVFENEKSITLTREALEELYMVWKGQLLVASSTFYTSSSTNPVFSRSTLTNLSEVTGVLSERSLIFDIPFPQKLRVSSSTREELASIDITSDILLKDFAEDADVDTSERIEKNDKMEALSKINTRILTVANTTISREALEEIYYVLNDYLTIDTGSTSPSAIEPWSYFKFDGELGSTDKKKDEYLTYPLTEYSVTSVSGREDVSDTAYGTASGQYLKGYTPTPFTTATKTYSTWIKTTQTGTSAIYSFNTVNSVRSFFVIWLENGKISPELAWPDHGMGTTGSVIVNDGSWHKIDVTLENSPNATMKLYIDGVLDAETVFTSAYNLTYITNDIFIGALQNYGNGAIQHHFNGSIDDVRVYNSSLSATDILSLYNQDANPEEFSPTYGIFDRANLGLLEPISGTDSENEGNITNNVNYSLTDDDKKIISDDTKGELSMVGITSRSQIVDIMEKTPMVLKDSKMHYFKEYVQQTRGYTMSREALEEAYLIYSGKEIFLTDVATQATTSVTKTLTTTDSTYILKQTANGTQSSTAVTSCDLVIRNSPSYVSRTCELTVPVQSLDGYNLDKVTLKFTGVPDTVPTTVNEASITESPAGGTINLTNYESLLGKYVVNFGYPSAAGNSATYTLATVSIISNYSVPSAKMDRNTFGSLKTISPYSALESTYKNELLTSGNSPTSTATTTKYLVSTTTLTELTSLGATTTAQVLDLFVNASSTQSKNSQLYSVYLYAKTLGVTLTRLALEEIWNVKDDKEMFANEITYSATTTTITETVQMATPTSSHIGSSYIWVNSNEYSDQNMCYSMSKVDTHCYMDFGDLTKPGYTLNSATVTMNYYNEQTNNYNVYFAIPDENVWPLHKVPITVDMNAKIVVSGNTGTQGAQSIDVTDLINTQVTRASSTDVDLVLTHIPSENISTNYTNWWYTQYNGWNNMYGIQNPYLSLRWSTTSTTTSTSTYSVFDPFSISDYLVSSDINSLLASYNSQNGLATTTTSIVIPEFCNSIIELCADTSTSTATTTIGYNASSTAVTDTTSSCNILNPYAYPFTVDSNCDAIFTLPDGSTTTDATIKIYDTIAKNLRNSEDEIYTKYYPSLYYELDNRNVITINIPFNGKTIGTYRYSPDTTFPPEVSYMSLNYQGSPVIVTDETSTTTQKIKSDAWGVRTTNSYIPDAVLPTTLGYTGHKYDSDSNLTYAHARYLSNDNKVWLSHDPYSINNFTNGTWLMNPQIQNSYSYSSNNPVNMIDPDGKKPTWEEARLMAQDIYSNTPGNNLSGGWKLDTMTISGDHMVMGQYSRTTNGSTEYTLSFKGTDSYKDEFGNRNPYFYSDWKNNIQQPFGESNDATAAIAEATRFALKHDGADITTTGHSKGGAEAMLAAVYNNLSSIVFNPARASFKNNGILSSWNSYSGTIDIFKSEGEILTSVFGTNYGPQVKEYTLTSQNFYNPAAPGNFGISTSNSSVSVSSSFSGYAKNSYVNHFMGNVILGNIK